jgi:hypothetical protein
MIDDIEHVFFAYAVSRQNKTVSAALKVQS